MQADIRTASKELEVQVLSGWLMLPITIALLLGGPALIVVVAVMRLPPPVLVTGIIMGALIEGTGILSAVGLFTLQPNEARVLILFGAYKGTVRTAGFHWGNPFYANGGMEMTGNRVRLSRNKISLRLRNLNGEKLKVNDKRGNPIEIAAVVVWRVHDTAQAFFDVDNYTHYVEVQSEAAVRHLASRFAYDHGEENAEKEVTLRGGVEQVSAALKQELEDRLSKAGVEVEEARITHLAYAPEIAQAMLRRQQAEAVIAARTKIVQGAVGMVSMALEELSKKGVVTLDDERRAAMVSNLMVVLCGESEVHPVVNTGTLYT